MSKPPPNGQIEIAKSIAEMAVEAEQRRASDDARLRAMHDHRIALNVAAELAAEWQRELARPPRAPRRPGEGEVPAARFGPGDRRTGSERK